MEPRLTSSTTTFSDLDNWSRTAEVLAHPASVGEPAGLAHAVGTRAHLTLASAPVWRHKLVLTGRLDHRTVVELEDEIECLYEEGVTILALDLRQIDAIDPVVANVIASQGAAFKRRGRDVVVVADNPVVHRALAEAGAESLLAGETGVFHLAARASNGSARDTVMIKNL